MLLHVHVFFVPVSQAQGEKVAMERIRGSRRATCVRMHTHIFLTLSPLCGITGSAEPGQIPKAGKHRCVHVCVCVRARIRAGSDLQPL